jgi:DNA primase
MRAGHEELQEMLTVLDIEEWLNRHGIRYRVTRGGRGVQLNVRECPCCGGTHYKVYINRETGLGNCFHGDCERRFNKWSFIRAVLGGVSASEVVDHIREVVREQGWRPSRETSMAVDLATRLVLPESVALPVGGRNLRYLDNRGVPGGIARYFNLRFSRHGVFRYPAPEGGGERMQDYSMRVIIPVFGLDGDLVSFQGRDITGRAERKYLFPPGIGAAGSHLYNGHNVVRAGRAAEHAVIGEGAFDVAAIKIAFETDRELRNIVPLGTFGKHLSMGGDDSQLARLLTLRAHGLKHVTFMWDGEPRATDDAIEAGLLLRRYGFEARIAVLPRGRDPAECAPSVVREAFWKAQTVNGNVAVRMRLARHAA